MYFLVGVFVVSLLIVVGASAWFTRQLEVISDLFEWSPGLLSLLGAVGANIPNYVASLVAAFTGQVVLGIGIIIGSNIYNIAVILAISTFASPAHHGITLSREEARDARLVGGYTLALMCATELAIAFFSWKTSFHVFPQAAFVAGIVFNLLTLGLFGVLSYHALQRTPGSYAVAQRETKRAGNVAIESSNRRWFIVRASGETLLAIAIALAGVIVMVQAGEAFARDVHLPPAILSLLILAVATSLPNTVVALTLARTGRASASVEEVFSSNSVNAALGIGLPLLFFSSVQADRALVLLDGPLMALVTLIALLCLRRRRMGRVIGSVLIFVYIGWVVIHLLPGV